MKENVLLLAFAALASKIFQPKKKDYSNYTNSVYKNVVVFILGISCWLV